MIENPFYGRETQGEFNLHELGNLILESGETLRGAKLAYRTFGKLNATKSNAILVTTWFSGTGKVMEDVYRITAEDVLNLTKANHVDLMEVCCPENSSLGGAVEAQGGTVVRCGLFNGFDMATATGVRRAIHLLRRVRPRRLVLSPPCTADCAIQNLNQITEGSGNST